MDSTVKNLMFDISDKTEIFDTECKRSIPNKEANDVLRFSIKNVLGLSDKPTERDIKRALRSEKGKEFMSVTEEILDKKITTGFLENEFFNRLAEYRSATDGDENEFVAEKDIILNVGKVSGDHHDLIMQKLGNGTKFQVPISQYAVKVGTDIRLFLTGRKDWGEWTDAVSKAFVNKIQNTIYSEFINMSSKLPAASGLKQSGQLAAATKTVFDEMIEKVSGLNQTEVMIVGTKTALKTLNNIGDVTWRSEEQKNAVATTGILSDYEGTILVPILQRYNNDNTFSPIINSKKLLILPIVSDASGKPIKIFDYGETILEETEPGVTMNDQQSYEVQRKIGVSTVLTRYIGEWEITG